MDGDRTLSGYELTAECGLRRLGVSSRARDLLVTLSLVRNHRTGRCAPGLRYLADLMRCSQATLIAAIAELAAAGLVSVEPGRGRRPSHYQIHIDALGALPWALNRRDSASEAEALEKRSASGAEAQEPASASEAEAQEIASASRAEAHPGAQDSVALPDRSRSASETARSASETARSAFGSPRSASEAEAKQRTKEQRTGGGTNAHARARARATPPDYRSLLDLPDDEASSLPLETLHNWVIARCTVTLSPAERIEEIPKYRQWLRTLPRSIIEGIPYDYDAIYTLRGKRGYWADLAALYPADLIRRTASASATFPLDDEDALL